MSKIKKKKKKATKNQTDNIKSFLSKIGIRRNGKEFSEEYWNEIRNEGVEPDVVREESGPFGERRNYMYFLTENIAKKTLSSDYDRLYSSIKSFTNLSGFPKNPSRILELGGGAGVISLWLAKKFVESNVKFMNNRRIL